MFINRDKVRELLKEAKDKASHTEKARFTEKALAHNQGITYPTYWRRCKFGRWRQEQIESLGLSLGRIIGKKPITVPQLAICDTCEKPLDFTQWSSPLCLECDVPFGEDE